MLKRIKILKYHWCPSPHPHHLDTFGNLSSSPPIIGYKLWSWYDAERYIRCVFRIVERSWTCRSASMKSFTVESILGRHVETTISAPDSGTPVQRDVIINQRRSSSSSDDDTPAATQRHQLNSDPGSLITLAPDSHISCPLTLCIYFSITLVVRIEHSVRRVAVFVFGMILVHLVPISRSSSMITNKGQSSRSRDLIF